MLPRQCLTNLQFKHEKYGSYWILHELLLHISFYQTSSRICIISKPMTCSYNLYLEKFVKKG